MTTTVNIHHFRAGDMVLREDTAGNSAFIVLSGVVEISKRVDDHRVVLGRLGAGSIFGEMSLMDGRPRSATVTAVEETRLSVVDHRRFQFILNSIPKEVRPLFSSLSERLRNTSEMVSGLSLRERLFYSICSIIRISSSTLGATDGSGGIRYPYQELLKEVCRVLTLSQNKIEEEIRDLAETGLVKIENVSGGDDTASLLVPDFEVFSGFVDFLSEQLSHLPGFPVPSRKYLVLTGKSQEILFFLKNKSADLPMDKDGRSHYNFDLYVSESVESLGCGVKDAILDIQKIAASGTIKLAKNSEVVGNKAIVYDVEDVSRAQLILLQAEEFNKIYKDIRKKN